MCRSELTAIETSTGKNQSSRMLLKSQKRKAMQAMRSTPTQVQRPIESPPLCQQQTLNTDLLAVATASYRRFTNAATEFFSKWQDSKVYRIFFHTTQPAHVITIVAVSIIATLVFPNKSIAASNIRPSPLINLVYLAAFMMHFGAQMWMTFVSGLTLYFEIPRHTFGVVQKALFPKYFSLNSFLSLITVFVFVKLHPRSTWDSNIVLQISSMVVCFLLELIIRLYLTPPLLRLMTAKTAIEKAAGVGLEIGKHDPGLLAQCPHYVKMHQAFRKVHMGIAIGNLLTMACTTVHLHYLASKLCFL